MLDNPEIQAIICARGGYGTSRIIDRIDFSGFLEKPKWIAGYSDITVLHCHLHRRGVQSIHSIMPLTFSQVETQASVDSLRRVLFGEAGQYQAPVHPLNREGEAGGVVIGGNLSLLVTIVGTPSDIDTAGKILFIEDVGEYYYHVDRMMIQLKRAGKLAGLAGLVVGGFSEMKDSPTPFGKPVYEIIDFPVGHEPVNMAMPCGRKAQLHVTAEDSRLQFPGHTPV
jgi:muramoyltetrapeptide carboxypeptidase